MFLPNYQFINFDILIWFLLLIEYLEWCLQEQCVMSWQCNEIIKYLHTHCSQYRIIYYSYAGIPSANSPNDASPPPLLFFLSANLTLFYSPSAEFWWLALLPRPLRVWLLMNYYYRVVGVLDFTDIFIRWSIGYNINILFDFTDIMDFYVFSVLWLLRL